MCRWTAAATPVCARPHTPLDGTPIRRLGRPATRPNCAHKHASSRRGIHVTYRRLADHAATVVTNVVSNRDGEGLPRQHRSPSASHQADGCVFVVPCGRRGSPGPARAPGSNERRSSVGPGYLPPRCEEMPPTTHSPPQRSVKDRCGTPAPAFSPPPSGQARSVVTATRGRPGSRSARQVPV
jgi:hypothetical protein